MKRKGLLREILALSPGFPRYISFLCDVTDKLINLTVNYKVSALGRRSTRIRANLPARTFSLEPRRSDDYLPLPLDRSAAVKVFIHLRPHAPQSRSSSYLPDLKKK